MRFVMQNTMRANRAHLAPQLQCRGRLSCIADGAHDIEEGAQCALSTRIRNTVVKLPKLLVER